MTRLLRQLGRWRASTPWLEDLALAMGTGALTVVFASQLEATSDSFGDTAVLDSGAAVLVVLGPSLLVIWRRHWQVVLPLAFVVQAVVWAIGFGEPMLAMTILLYTAVGRGGRRGLVSALVVLALLVGWTTVGYTVGDTEAIAIPLVGFYGAVGVLVGRTVASNRTLAAMAEERAAEVEARRRSDQERIRHEERTDLARELHDVVAHHLSVMVVQAGAARAVLAAKPAVAGEAIEQIEHVGRSAMDEMRQIVGALRTNPDAEWAPTAGLGSIDTLVQTMTEAGLVVTVDQVDRGELPSVVDVSAFRVVQEALTNTLRHAGPGTAAHVRIEQRKADLLIEVVDCGRPNAESPNRQSPNPDGHGLRGMAERAALLGGSVDAGRRPDGGFGVNATLPLR